MRMAISMRLKATSTVFQRSRRSAAALRTFKPCLVLENSYPRVAHSSLTRILGVEVRSRLAYPYRFYYRLGGTAPEVIAVLHTARDTRTTSGNAFSSALRPGMCPDGRREKLCARGKLRARTYWLSTQVSLLPPPWLELTTSEPRLSATRVRPPGTIETLSP